MPKVIRTDAVIVKFDGHPTTALRKAYLMSTALSRRVRMGT
jgi:hypothetical protein